MDEYTAVSARNAGQLLEKVRASATDGWSLLSVAAQGSALVGFLVRRNN